MQPETHRPDLATLWPGEAATPLLDLPLLAQLCGVGRILVKDESRRPLGNFKSLGGTLAGLRALARATGAASIEALRPEAARAWTLVCASDGNHGLAVAAAAQWAGAGADIHLHGGVPEARARRLRDRGARVLRSAGTYDDSVDEAKRAADRPGAILVADTDYRGADRVSADILEGYQRMTAELRDQIARPARLSHAFVQAGVGGLAAAVARGLERDLAVRPWIVVVEPDAARCVAAGLAGDGSERLAGDLETVAEMLGCGQASRPALDILRAAGAEAIGVDEATLADAVDILARAGGPASTPSGAAGLAGLLKVARDPALAAELGLDGESEVLLIVSEGPVPDAG